ncbi:MAG: hypothetical protein WKF77_24735 [Planctomycetaceae bacterium]
MPLISYGKLYSPHKGHVDPKIDMKTPVREQVHRMDAETYFNTLTVFMKDNPTAKSDAKIIDKMAKTVWLPAYYGRQK